MIPYGRQHVDDDDVDAVAEVLRSAWLTQGPTGPQFEEDLARRVDAPFAVAFSSGTAALHAAVAAAGIGPGHTAATSALTFAASANCALYEGAAVELVDVEPDTLNLDPTLVPPDVDCLVAVHYAGLPLDLTRLARRPRVVIEDAAHALGAHTADGPVGNCAHSDMCVFSFHPVKSMTAAEGGAVTTRSAELADRLRRFRNHGIEQPTGGDPWAYEIREVGFNHRLSDVHAALGRSQLRKLDRFVERRNELAERYDQLLADLPLRTPSGGPAGVRHARHLYPVRVPERAAVYRRLREADVGVQVHYVPLHHHPRFAEGRSWHLPRTDEAYAELLSLPLFPDLTDRQQDDVVTALRRVLEEVAG